MNSRSAWTKYEVMTEQLMFLCILFVTIVVGNFLILAGIVSSGKRRSRMNVFIINLACADLSVGCLLVLTDIIWKVTITWYGGYIGCKVVKFAQCVATFGATYSLVALSIDRLDAIARPMNINNVERRCRILVGLAWLFAVLFSSPMLYMSEMDIVDGKEQCWIDLQPWIYVTMVSFAVLIIPAIIIASCYIAIAVVIWSKSNKFKSPDTRRCSEKSSLSKSVFIFCWAPYFIWDLLYVFGHIKMSQRSIAISTFIQSLAPLNSAANPIIYTLFNTAIFTGMFKKRHAYNSPPHTPRSI
ncbi:CCAPR-like protein [Mya arenaria]|uniref:CCAPR-like protein n=1 Tax=Mya arenaria TaxID=6604 RepID=A0ABY7ER74_MYAAR|nr:CCAPR-like protein [Mya arenaria]